MARMIPVEIPIHTASRAERELFPVFQKELDDSFTVFHSFSLLTKNRENKFIDGEIDYLVFSKELGFLVIEVKSGAIAYEGSTGMWTQNGHQLRVSPFNQAQASKYKLRDFLARRLGHHPSISIGHAVCFPSVFTELSNLPSGAEREICITGSDLQDINSKLLAIMTSYVSKGYTVLSHSEAEHIRHILMPHCEYGMSLVDRLGHAERKVFALTENQCQVLDFISLQKRALIEGCAGSGKTIMAVKKARELAGAGKSVLLLSYNRMIGDYLSDTVKDLANVTASTYHTYCLEQLRRAGCLPPEHDNRSYWENDIPEAFADLIRMQSLTYDAVIIDEGQDFRLEYWITISELVAPAGYYYIFYDPAQNIFGTRMEFPIGGAPYKLVYNCRNTRAIFNALKPYSGIEGLLKDGASEGDSVIEFHLEDREARRKELGEIIYDLLEKQHLDIDRIVIIGGHSIERTCIGTRNRIANYTISEGEEEGSHVIHYHTYMKFKGCEADAVILIDVDPSDERWSNPMALYTSISRSKYLLYILWTI